MFKDIGKHKVKEIVKGDIKIKVGDFLNTCWGYDQTNVELFTVKKILGKNYVIIQEVAKKRENSGSMTYYNVSVDPTIEKIDIPVKAFISDDGYMHVCELGYRRSLGITDINKKHYETDSMYGH